MYHIQYHIEGTSDMVTIATTRPETMLGDTAVCVHPDDERYKHLIGKKVVIPIINRAIPVIADTYVDKDFGSGVVKITPAHDFNDYKIGIKHKLEFINILNKKTELNENGGPYAGLKVQEARKQIVEKLRELGLLVKEEPHLHSVGHCSRSNAVVEPFLSEQWFVKTENLAVPAKRVVESGTIRFEPESWTKVYLHWMNIIEDWCISRQLWWGHRIPAWNCADCGTITVAETSPGACEKCNSKVITQDEDVLDTWFSSALWPFSTMGWPNDTETQKTFYPTSYLVTGHDIIFFWVARMIMMGLEFKRDVPFRTVYIHGLVRDAQGLKMSKSLGNSIDPVEMIEKHGADALRFTFLAHLFSGRDLKFSEQRLEGYRNFMNKIWNGSRYALTHLKDFEVPSEGQKALPPKPYMSLFDQWILTKLHGLEKTMDESLEQERFSDAATALYQFIWNDFCDWYIEFSKPILTGDRPHERKATQLALAQVLNRFIRLLHPFCPFITEEIYQKLPIRNQSCILDTYPNVRTDRELLEFGSESVSQEVDFIKEIISSIRNIRGENRISPAEILKIRIGLEDPKAQKILGENKTIIETLARIQITQIGLDGNISRCAVNTIALCGFQAKVIIPLEGIVDLEEEVRRIQKLVEKLHKDIGILNGKLNNEKFLANADPDLVSADRELLEQSKVKIVALQESLGRFQN